jgi:hypothetical protein
MPIDRSKGVVAARLAQSHYEVDPAIDQIFRVVAPGREEIESEPIKLLEVNRDTSMSGILPIHFGPHAASGIFYPSVIIEVRPEEFELIVNGQLALPDSWTLADMFPPPTARVSA